MREIKFRAWFEGRMHEVNYVHWVDNKPYPGSLEVEGNMGDVPFMQYTGLKDKHGVEIYEGDIVRLHESHFIDGKLIVKAVFKNGYFGFTPDETFYEPMFLEANKSEVIGNIYENPELLEAAS